MPFLQRFAAPSFAHCLKRRFFFEPIYIPMYEWSSSFLFFFPQSDTFIYVHFFKNRQAPKFNEQLENSINCSHRWQEGGHGTCTFPRASQNMQSVWPRATRTTWQHRKTKKVGIGAMKKPKKYIILISGRKTIKKTKKNGFGSEKTVKKIRRNPTFFLVFRRFPTKSGRRVFTVQIPQIP